MAGRMHSGGDHGEVLLTEQQIRDRTHEIAQQIMDDHPEGLPYFMCLMKGGLPFASLLMQSIVQIDPASHPRLEYMMLTTYGQNRKPSPPRIVMDASPESIDQVSVEGSLIIVDDLLDQGHTYDFARRLWGERGVSVVKLAVLATKEVARPDAIAADYSGFDLPDVWLTGMGMDDGTVGIEANRWLPYVATGTNSAPE